MSKCAEEMLMSSLESSRRRGSRKDGSRGHAQGLAGVERETSSEGTRQSLHAAASPWHPAHQGSCACRAQTGTQPATGHTGPRGPSEPSAWLAVKQGEERELRSPCCCLPSGLVTWKLPTPLCDPGYVRSPFSASVSSSVS